MTGMTLKDVPLETLLAELRERAGESLPKVDLMAFTTQQLVAHFISNLQFVPLSFYGVPDIRSIERVYDNETKRDMESAAFIFFQKNDPIGPYYEVETRVFSDEFPPCNKLPFGVSRLVTGGSSGVLLAPQLLATAHHVIPNEQYQTDARVIFGFHANMIQGDKLHVHRDDVFRLANVRKRNIEDDWVLFDLDRVATRPTIRSVRREGKIEDARRVHLISHPRGMVTSCSPDAQVRGNNEAKHFSATVDALRGSSGGAVFDAVDHQIEGLLVSGNLDETPTSLSCVKWKEFPSSAMGERIIRITEIAPYIP